MVPHEERTLPPVALEPRKVLTLLIGLSLLFLLLNVVRLGWSYELGSMRFHEILARFNLDNEASIPTWFSSMVLLAASAALAVIAAHKRAAHDRFARHWIGLAVIFLLLSVEEIATFHELLSARMGSLHLTGFLSFAWVIPAGCFVLLFALAYLRFLLHLPAPFRVLFVVSGVVYVFGAVGMEMIGGEIKQTWGVHGLYYLCVMVEEGCEMLGASLFVFTQLKYLQTMTAQVGIRLSASEPAANPSPAPARHHGDWEMTVAK